MMRFQFILSIALLYLVVVTLVLHKLIPQIVTVEEQLPPTPSNQTSEKGKIPPYPDIAHKPLERRALYDTDHEGVFAISKHYALDVQILQDTHIQTSLTAHIQTS